MINQQLLDAHHLMMKRYSKVLQESTLPNKDHWISFCETSLTLTNSDKLSRWVGFIQGVLFSHHLISIDEERDFSRAIYKPIYEELGLDSYTVEV